MCNKREKSKSARCGIHIEKEHCDAFSTQYWKLVVDMRLLFLLPNNESVIYSNSTRKYLAIKAILGISSTYISLIFNINVI